MRLVGAGLVEVQADRREERVVQIERTACRSREVDIDDLAAELEVHGAVEDVCDVDVRDLAADVEGDRLRDRKRQAAAQIDQLGEVNRDGELQLTELGVEARDVTAMSASTSWSTSTSHVNTPDS